MGIHPKIVSQGKYSVHGNQKEFSDMDHNLEKSAKRQMKENENLKYILSIKY